MKCPTTNCHSHVIKKGKLYLKADRTYVQRYQCIICKKNFINRNKIERKPNEKLYSTRKDVAELYCRGMSLRDISKTLKVSRTTVMSKLDLVSNEIENKLRDYANFNFNSHHEDNYKRTPIIVFDEMETYEHTKLKPLSITIAYDVINKKIVDIQVATFFPKGRFVSELKKKPHLRIKYEIAKRQRDDNRTETTKNVLNNVKKYLEGNSNTPLFITDGKAGYVSILREVFKTYRHEVIISREVVENFIKYDKYGISHKHIKEKASLDSVCAIMRAKLSRLRRDSFIHTKKIINLQKNLFLFMDYWNNNHQQNQSSIFD